MLNRSDYCLRMMLEADLEKVLVWRNSDRVRYNMYTDDIISMDEHVSWYQRSLNDLATFNMICEFQSRPIAVANATQIDKVHGKCMWGFYLGDLMAPKGSSYVMGLLFLDYIFNNFSLRKVCSEVLEFNADSIGFHLNLGFSQEGILTSHILKRGTSHDVAVFSLLASQWRAKRTEIEARLFSPISS
jgi:UDP-4-amino-4,6-dideoxy-N-acetyl-beta-L-altrosamine N-acetyltransferase